MLTESPSEGSKPFGHTCQAHLDKVLKMALGVETTLQLKTDQNWNKGPVILIIQMLIYTSRVDVMEQHNDQDLGHSNNWEKQTMKKKFYFPGLKTDFNPRESRTGGTRLTTTTQVL